MKKELLRIAVVTLFLLNSIILLSTPTAHAQVETCIITVSAFETTPTSETYGPNEVSIDVTNPFQINVQVQVTGNPDSTIVGYISIDGSAQSLDQTVVGGNLFISVTVGKNSLTPTTITVESFVEVTDGTVDDITITVDEQFSTIGLETPCSPPNKGLLKINADQLQTVYESAGGNPIRNADGSELMIPQDYDGNGFDTFTIAQTATIDEQVWYGIWLGSENWGWVPATNLTILE